MFIPYWRKQDTHNYKRRERNTEYYQNLDLDKCDKQQLNRIIEKIKSNPCSLSVTAKDSTSKGYHVMLICSKKCDICRFVFDDMKRYEIDFNRDEKFKNVIFEKKEYFKGNMGTIKHFCERCAKYNIQTTLTKRELELQDVKVKMRIGKIKGYPYQLVYLTYNYFECPICHWFKFITKPQFKRANIEGYNE